MRYAWQTSLHCCAVKRNMEVRGVEPLSEKLSKAAATRLVHRLFLALPHAEGQAYGIASAGTPRLPDRHPSDRPAP
jgi:hypothetical protein